MSAELSKQRRFFTLDSARWTSETTLSFSVSGVAPG